MVSQAKSTPEELRERKRARDKAYYHKNKVRSNAISRAYYQEHKEEMKAYQKKFYAENSELIKERNKVYGRRSYSKNFKAKQEYQKNHWASKRDAVFEVLGGKVCVTCGFTDDRALQFDHVYGGGNQHYASFTSNKKYLAYIIENPSEFQVLCANCNTIKRIVERQVRISKLVSND